MRLRLIRRVLFGVVLCRSPPSGRMRRSLIARIPSPLALRSLRPRGGWAKPTLRPVREALAAADVAGSVDDVVRRRRSRRRRLLLLRLLREDVLQAVAIAAQGIVADGGDAPRGDVRQRVVEQPAQRGAPRVGPARGIT